MSRITVVVPCYNVRGCVLELCDDLRRQTLGDWEAVFVDDFSNDGTAEVLKEFWGADPRVRIVRTDYNSGGVFVPRAEGIRIARTDLICLLDADDRINGKYLEAMPQRIDATGASAVFPDMVLGEKHLTRIPLDGVYAGSDLVALSMYDNRIGCNGGVYKTRLLTQVYCDEVPRMWEFFRTEILKNMSAEEEETFLQFAETDSGLPRYIDEVATRMILRESAKVAFAPEAVYQYCPGENSVSASSTVRSFSFAVNDLLLVLWLAGEGFSSPEEEAAARRQQFYGLIDKIKSFLKMKDQLDPSEKTAIDRFLDLMFGKIERPKLKKFVGSPLFMLTSTGYQMTKKLLWLHGSKGWRPGRKLDYTPE